MSVVYQSETTASFSASVPVPSVHSAPQPISSATRYRDAVPALRQPPRGVLCSWCDRWTGLIIILAALGYKKKLGGKDIARTNWVEEEISDFRTKIEEKASYRRTAATRRTITNRSFRRSCRVVGGEWKTVCLISERMMLAGYFLSQANRFRVAFLDRNAMQFAGSGVVTLCMERGGCKSKFRAFL